MLGLIVAAVGIALSHAFHAPEIDAIASILIGVILAGSAALLAFESKGLLIGEAASRDLQDSVRAIIEESPGILATNELLTMHLGPRDILINLSLDFEDRLSSVDVEAAISNLERRIKDSTARSNACSSKPRVGVATRQMRKKNRNGTVS